MPDFALYRDKERQNYAQKAEEFVQMCKPLPHTKCFLHGDYTLAHSLNAAGVHLTSTQFHQIDKAKQLGLEVIISTHSQKEISIAEEMGADYVTYSPIFATPNKGEPKGVEKLAEMVEKNHIKIFALGGIVTKEHREAVAQSGAYGFASIRYFL